MKEMNLQLFGEREDDAADRILELVNDYERMGVTDAIGISTLAQLTRAADALEDINATLIELTTHVTTLTKEGKLYIGGEVVTQNLN